MTTPNNSAYPDESTTPVGSYPDDDVFTNPRTPPPAEPAPPPAVESTEGPAAGSVATRRAVMTAGAAGVAGAAALATTQLLHQPNRSPIRALAGQGKRRNTSDDDPFGYVDPDKDSGSSVPPPKKQRSDKPADKRQQGRRAANPPAGSPDRDQSYNHGSRTRTTPPGTLAKSADKAAKVVKLSPAEAQRHLLNRATFGASTADQKAIRSKGVDAWLAQQLSPHSIDDSGVERLLRQLPLASKDISGVRGSVKEYAWDAMGQLTLATIARQAFSQRQLYEIVVDVLHNALNVTIPFEGAWDSGPHYVNTVIRKYAFGSYRDMLKAAMRHPAMLRFLNNDESHKQSVNENLGRELLELHTVGVTAGYTETDVRNSAYILTGRTVDRDGKFVYKPDMHWTGAVKVMGFRNANSSAANGLAMGDKYLDYLATHPATATAIARRLAVRFVADSPPESLVARMAKAYLAHGTAIVPVLTTMFASTEFWLARGAKARRPLEDIIGSVRSVGISPTATTVEGLRNLQWQLTRTGHVPMAWPAPNGYPDVFTAWRSASGMITRWNVHRSLANGWMNGLKPAARLAQSPAVGQSVDTWLRALAAAAGASPLSAAQHQALITYAGGKTVTKEMARQTADLTALILDSPGFQLR